MKTFIDICKMKQNELKQYLAKYFGSKRYECIMGDGYLLCCPKKDLEKQIIPVMLVAHMDTVHKEQISEVNIIPYTVGNNIETRISSPQGIGGDDRCGVWALMDIAKEFYCYYLFCEDEETGCIGSGKFIKTPYCEKVAKEINYMIEVDRRGLNDAVFYSCDNADFTEWIITNTKFEKAFGTFTDIEELMPKMKVAGVNFSSGYYRAHTTDEYVVKEELEEVISRIKDLLSLEIPKKFEYVRKTYNTYGYGAYSRDRYEDWDSGYFKDRYGNLASYYENKYGNSSKRKDSLLSTTNSKSSIDEELELIVEVDGFDWTGDEFISAFGQTKYECWTHLFKENPDLSYGMIGKIEWR